jgi:tape measure domain-containing protein
MDVATLGLRIDATPLDRASSSLDRLGASGGRAQASMTSAERAAASMGVRMSSLNAVVGAFGVTLGLAAVVAFARDLAKTVEQVQNLSIRLKGLTKDATDYAGVQAYLVQISDKHHKSNLGLTASFAGLLAIEQTGVITRKQSTALLEGLSNVQSKTGATAENLKSSMIGLTQALSMGTLQWEEMKQVTEPLPGLMTKIAEAAGYTGKSAVGDFKAVVSAGQVTSDMFGRVMVNAMAQYEGAAVKAGDSITAKYADIDNAWTSLATALETPVAETLTAVLEAATWQLEQFAIQARYVKSIWQDIFGKSVTGGAPDNGMVIDLTGRAKPPTTVDSSAAEAAALRAEIEATKKSTVAKKAHKTAISDVQKAINSLQFAYEALAASQAKEAALKGDTSKIAALEYDLIRGSLRGLSSEKKLYLLQQAAEIHNNELASKASETQKTELDSLKDKYNQLTLSAREYFQTQLSGKGISGDAQAPILAQFDKNAGVEASQKSIDTARASMEAYNATLDQTNDKFAKLSDVSSSVFDASLGGINAVTGAFTNMLKALDENTGAIEKLHQAKVANDKFEVLTNKRSAADIKKNNGQYLVDLQTIHKFKSTYALKEKLLEGETLKSALSGTRQTAAATAQMFAEGSAARKAFSIVSLAASIAERLQDISSLGVKAAIAVLEQGKGDPYTAFARIAAMAAIVASVISAAGAGTFNFAGGGSVSAPPPTSPDTGTVLGDSAAKSESIDKTYSLLKDIHASEYRELRGINAGIASLSTGITDVITRLFQAGGLSDVTMPAAKITGVSALIQDRVPILGAVTNAITSFLFGGKTTSTVVGQGISTGRTSLSNIMDGGNLKAQQFADIQTVRKGGIFSSDKTSYSRQTSALDTETQKALNGVFKSMGETMMGLADNLGAGLSDRVKNYIIPALSVDLKGLNGEDAAKKLNGVISTALDTMSSAVFGDIIGQYQQLGEGLLETAVRIVSEVAVVKDALATSGISLADNAIAISDAIVQAAGGLKEFQAAFETYYDKFYSDSEKQTRLHAQLSEQLGDVSLGLADSREGYRKQLEALDLSTDAGQRQYSMLLKLSEGADEYYKGVEEAQAAAAALAKAEADRLAALVKSRHDMEIELMALSGNAVGALTAKRQDELAAMDESLRATQNLINTMQDLASIVSLTKAASATAMQVLQASVGAERKMITDKYNAGIKTTQAAIDGLTKSTDKLRGLSSALKSFLDNLVVAGQESIRRATAQAQIGAAIALVQAGGSIQNPDELIKAVDSLAQPSEQLFGTFVDYQRDFLKTAIDIDKLHKLTDLGLTVDDKQLAALRESLDTDKRWFDAEMSRLDAVLSTAKDQLDAVNGVTVAVMSVESAIANLAAAISAQGAAQTAQRAVQGAAQSQASGGGGAATLSGINQSYQDILGRDADPGGLIHWANSGQSASSVALSIATSAEAQVNNLYSSLLGRAADSAGAAYWTAALNSGASLSDITAGFTGSQEYKSLNGFDVGINEVPYDMTANIHKGERIFPAADNKELMMRLSEPRRDDSRSYAELIAEVRALRAELRAGQAAQVSETKGTNRILRDVTQDGTAITTVAA